jgi:hypothetical protein
VLAIQKDQADVLENEVYALKGPLDVVSQVKHSKEHLNHEAKKLNREVKTATRGSGSRSRPPAAPRVRQVVA